MSCELDYVYIHKPQLMVLMKEIVYSLPLALMAVQAATIVSNQK